MATATPPCPKCAGVLRRSYIDDSAICRCGFTVDHEAIVAYGGDAARLLAAGRMTPIPEGTPGIRVGDTFGEVTHDMWDSRYVSVPPNSEQIGSTAREYGATVGLVYQGQGKGRHLCVEVIPSSGAGAAARFVERKVIYGVAPFGDIHEASRQMVKFIADKHGPGRWWSMTDAVHIAADDGQARVGDIGGVPHVVLRAVYFHDPLPKPIDPLDVEYDGVALRQLVEWDAAAGREEFVLDPDSPSRSIAAVVVRAAFSSSQRAAVSAHWSAELRKRTDAAKQKDRNQVTMEYDDE